MENLIFILKEIFMKKEFLKFLFVGVINTFNGTVFSTVYGIYFQANIAFVLGYLTSLFVAYFLNCKFIFGIKSEIDTLIKFIVSYIPNFIIQNVIVLLVYNGMGLNRIVAYGIAAVIGIPITFLCVKIWAFNKESG